jgi:uncharacterized OB-fold protein
MVIAGAFSENTSEDGGPHLWGSKCSSCGYTCFPEKKVCVKCLRDDTMERIPMGRFGTLETYAIMQIGTRDFPAPYVIGYVRTDEGVLIFSPITGCTMEDDALEIGQRMELVIEKIREDAEGNAVVGWKYRPAEGAPK